MNSLNLNLFQSTSAHFKLGITCIFTKKNPTTGKEWNGVKISQGGYATSDPSVFLTFGYSTGQYGDREITVFTSYPHLLRIRSIFEDLKEGILNERVFVNNRGLSVEASYAEARTIGNIGTDAKFISIRPVADALVDMTNNYIPAVEIIISNAPQACILTIDEFLTLYTILMDISLPEMAMLATVAKLNTLSSSTIPAYRSNNAYAAGTTVQRANVGEGGAPRVAYNANAQYRQRQDNRSATTATQQIPPRNPAGHGRIMNNDAIENVDVPETTIDDFNIDLGDDDLADLYE